MAKFKYPYLKAYLLGIVFITLVLTATFFYVYFTLKPDKFITTFGATNGNCNTDNVVDILDFQLLSNSFGKSQGQSGYNPNCNFNPDTTIDILDFQILSNNFGTTTVSPTPTSGPGPTGSSTIWHGDPDTNGINAWHRVQCPSGNVPIVDDPEGRYGKVYKTTLNTGETYSGDGSARCEFYGTDLPNGTYLKYREGDDYYFGWRSRISNGIHTDSGNSGNFLQLKGETSCSGPAIGLTMINGNLTLRTELSPGEFWTGPQMSTFTGRWHDIVLHVRFSTNPSVGFVEAWLDGVKQTFKDGSQRYQLATMCPGDTEMYLKMGYYRGSHPEEPPGTHWFESPRLGTSYNSVVPR